MLVTSNHTISQKGRSRDMNEALKVLTGRRSCRSYKPEQITDAELDAVLEAGIYAPTAGGQQSPIIVAVQDKDTIEQLRKMNADVMGNPDADPFYGAPTVLIVLADKANPNRVYDGSCVMDNLMNGAEAVGLGSCWIHRARQMFDSPEGKELLKQWGLPETLQGVGSLALGYPAQEPPAPPARKPGRVVKV